ncbi:uncharacterized protein [Primulina eburnea]|uniref:uncharacterized protein isoform X4 n=1 Tax=Primulina eburnea TaxID=1245227 RepID=UPI003C6C36A9
MFIVNALLPYLIILHVPLRFLPIILRHLILSHPFPMIHCFSEKALELTNLLIGCMAALDAEHYLQEIGSQEAIYAKLRSIFKAYGKHASRYASAPAYTKDVELPLPFALAIQELGVFETCSLLTNFVYAPTYPEGVEHEGRKKSAYPHAEYLSYLPTLKELGIPCKSIDPRVKTGSSWWTYKVKNFHDTHDLICTLPPSLYSDLSAIIRSVFLIPKLESNECKDVVQPPADAKDYGTRLKDVIPGSAVRSFLALCHGPEEEWSHGTN